MVGRIKDRIKILLSEKALLETEKDSGFEKIKASALAHSGKGNMNSSMIKRPSEDPEKYQIDSINEISIREKF